MAEDQSSSTDKPKKAQNKTDALEARIAKLELTIRMMAHFNGTNRVLDKCGLERWEPSKKELKRA